MTVQATEFAAWQLVDASLLIKSVPSYVMLKALVLMGLHAIVKEYVRSFVVVSSMRKLEIKDVEIQKYVASIMKMGLLIVKVLQNALLACLQMRIVEIMVCALKVVVWSVPLMIIVHLANHAVINIVRTLLKNVRAVVQEGSLTSQDAQAMKFAALMGEQDLQ